MEVFNGIFDFINTADLVLILIVVIFGIIGIVNGLVYSVFKIAAFVISVFIALTFYPTVSELLKGFGLKGNLENSITKGLLNQKDILFPNAAEGAQKGTSFLENIQLPEFLKNAFIKENQSLGEVLNIDTFINNIGAQIADLMINVLSIIILFIIARLALSLLKVILASIAKLPVFKQVDKIGGFAFGIIEGILTIYIICTILLLFSSTKFLIPAFQAINESKLAIYFYEKNIIAGFLFPKLTQ